MAKLLIVLSVFVVCSASDEAARIISFHDGNINPCDNFYRFACGNYKTNFTKSEHPLSNNDYIIRLIQQGSDFKPYKLMNDLFKTCVKGSLDVKGQSVEHLKKIIKNLGGSHHKDEFNWIDFSGKMKKLGFDVNLFLDWKQKPIYVGSQRTLRYSLTMAKGSKAEIYNRKAAQLFGLTEKDLEEAFGFEESLRKINATESIYYTEDISIEEMQIHWPGVDWRRFVDETLIPFVDTKPILTVSNDSAITKFAQLISNTPKRVLANYGIFKVVQYSVPYLTKEFQVYQGQKVPREEFCVGVVKKYIGIALEYLYLDQHKSSQVKIKSIVESVKREMTRMIEKSKKLSPEEKEEGIRTLNIPFTIGPSFKLENPEELKKYYDDIQVTDNFLETVLNFNIFRKKKAFSIKNELEVSIFNTAFSLSPGMPELQYDRLYVPTSMIPGPLFNENRPSALNFGTTGTYIAINIASSVSYIGRNLTAMAKGEEPPNDQLDCFRRFDNKTKPEDVITQYIGFQSSRAAYGHHGNPESFPGLPYNGNQLFWIGFAQSVCEAHSHIDESQELLMMKILSYIPKIGQDFQCPLGSGLNPEYKCSWW